MNLVILAKGREVVGVDKLIKCVCNYSWNMEVTRIGPVFELPLLRLLILVLKKKTFLNVALNTGLT